MVYDTFYTVYFLISTIKDFYQIFFLNNTILTVNTTTKINDVDLKNISKTANIDKSSRIKLKKLKKRHKRFIDKRNNFEKLRDSIYVDQDLLRRRCLSRPYQDILLLNEDDERFILNTRFFIIEYIFFYLFIEMKKLSQF
jgi:hypothetical protein